MSDGSSGSKAFNYEKGQFICHVFATISENEREDLEEIVESIISDKDFAKHWKPICKLGTNEDSQSSLHITLLRGHRAVYYHQIKPLVDSLRNNLRVIPPIRICLNDFRMFSNNENTKQFLCIAPNRSSSSENFSKLKNLKLVLKETIDQYAIKLTSEDETDDTVAHCSLMYCDTTTGPDQNNETSLNEFNKWYKLNSPDRPTCLVNINVIQVKIGNTIYKINLTPDER